MLIAKILYKSFYWKIFQFLASLIINIIFVRALRSSLSAELYSLSYLLALATSFFTLGLDISLNFYLSRKLISPAMARRIALAVVALALLVSLPLVGLLYRPLSYPGISPQKILLFAALNIAGNLLTVLSGAIFTAGGRNFLPVRISFQVNCLVILLSLLSSMVFSGSRLAEMLFWIYFSASLLQGLFLFVGSRRYDPPTANANTNIAPTADPSTAANTNTGSLALLPAILRFSLAAFIANFIFFAASRTGLYLLPYRAEPSSLGNYIQAFKIVEYMTTLAAFIYYPFMALVASENKEKMNGMVLFMVRLSNTFVLIAAILLLVTGRFLFPLVFGQSFNQMYALFIWLIPGVFAACSSSFFTAYFFGKGNVKYNLVSACILLSSALVFFFLFAGTWGLKGAACAYSLAAMISLLYDCLVFKKFSDYQVKDLLFARKADIDYIRSFVKQLLS